MAEKRVRSRAKASFTRALNELDKSINEKDPLDVNALLYTDLEQKFKNVLEKDNAYLETLTDENDDEQADIWINKVEDEYRSIRVKYVKYKLKISEDFCVRNVEVQKNEIANMISHISKLIERESSENIILKEKDNLNQSLILLKDSYTKLREVNSSEEYVKQLDELTEDVTNSNTSVNQYILYINDKKKKESTVTSGRVRMEKLPLPKFGGNVREYPRFRKEFMELVMPNLSNAESAFSLRKCISKSVELSLGACTEDVDEMLKKLDEKYGDPRKVVDSIISEIIMYGKINETDKESFIKFIDLIERARSDLSKLQLESELSSTNVISIIESKLPDTVSMEWYRHIHKSNIDKSKPFLPLLEFLKTERSAMEYSMSKTRNSYVENRFKKLGLEEKKQSENAGKVKKCWLHDSDTHTIEACYNYLAKSNEEKLNIIREKNVCWNCLNVGHGNKNCFKKKPCGKDNCQLLHHESLHEAHVAGMSFHTDVKRGLGPCILLVMSIPVFQSHVVVNVMWDTASTISLITFKKAKELKLSGDKINLTIMKAGGSTEDICSYRYHLNLMDKEGKSKTIVVYGIPTISTDLKSLQVDKIKHLFDNITTDDIKRPTGELDVLVGLEYASFHPCMIQYSDHLVIYENIFGKCIGGTHENLKEDTRIVISQAFINHLNGNTTLKQFFEAESLGVECIPKCGSCQCGMCAPGSKQYTLKEERELKLIESGLVFKGTFFEAKYPWTKDPRELPNNRSMAIALLFATEKRLIKDKAIAKLYDEQMKDMLDRGAARKLTKAELDKYQGPVHYIIHHEVLRPDHPTTPCRIVFHTSKNFHGHILNEYWAKGPDLINNMLGIILRFREEYICIVGDIKKMYHSVKIPEIDQHTHRFVWRNFNTEMPPETYVMTCVSFGDKPAGTIAQLALRKTADMKKDVYPDVWEIIHGNTYVDDILDSVPSVQKAIELSKNVDIVLQLGGFTVKSWFISNKDFSEKQKDCFQNFSENAADRIYNGTLNDKENENVSNQKVLGIKWNPNNDEIYFTVNLKFKKNIIPEKQSEHNESQSGSVPLNLTKRMILSQINGLFDPIGLASPVTIKAKMLMRRLWLGKAKELGWDDPVPNEERLLWVQFFEELLQMEMVTFARCLKPVNVTDERPTLIMFSDASENAYGACGYARWQLNDNSFCSRLIAAKSKVTPTKEMSIVRKELEGAVLAKRLQSFICNEMRYVFKDIYFLIDSEIVLAMLNKDSYGFHTYAALRVGEIQQATNPNMWFWIDGVRNIADWITRGKKPMEIMKGSTWQNGPDFLQLPVEKWPIKKPTNSLEIPEQIRSVMVTVGSCNTNNEVVSSKGIQDVIDIQRFSKYLTLIGTTARITSVIETTPASLANIKKNLTTEQYEKAKLLWVRACQEEFNEVDMDIKYARLCPQKLDNGIWVVGSRTEKWTEFSYNKQSIALLPFHHKFSRMYVEFVHSITHSGVMTSVAKVRLQFWIINLSKMMKSIIYHCILCRKRKQQFIEQTMSPLPIERLKPVPPWHYISVDYCGPFMIRGEVNRRSKRKGYMVLFNCLVSRAVHVDVAFSYDTNEFLKVLRRFFAIRGKPSIIYADNGTQIKAASKEMTTIIKGLNFDELVAYGAEEGISWKFTAPDAPWQNGCAEALIKSLKNCLKHAIGLQVLTPSEILTVAFEAANMLNERPIGRHPTSPEDGHYLCPNDLLLGRASSRVPQGPFNENVNDKQRFALVQSISTGFWKKMIRDYFPNLIIRQKWHTSRRNIKIGDIVLIQDINAIRGNWKLGKVCKIEESEDGHVRNCNVKYKLINDDLSTKKTFTTVRRPVQKLVIVLPVEEDVDYNTKIKL